MIGLKPGQFYFNGVDSMSRGIVIQYRPVIHTPERRVEFLNASAGNGDIPYDQKTYKNTPLELKLLYKDQGGDHIPTIANARTDIFDLFDVGNYVPMISYFDPDKVWQVMPKQGWDAALENLYWYEGHIVFDMELTCQPYKLLDGNINNKHTFTTSGTITAPPRVRGGWPKITITGNGNVNLIVNNVTYVIKSIEGNITIDSWSLWGYRESNRVISDQYSKLYFKDYPLLRKGQNTISVVPQSGGSVTRLEIEPGWRTLV